MGNKKTEMIMDRITFQLKEGSDFYFLEDPESRIKGFKRIIIENNHAQHQIFVNGGCLIVLSTIITNKGRADSILSSKFNKEQIIDIFTKIEDQSGRPIFPEWWTYIEHIQ